MGCENLPYLASLLLLLAFMVSPSASTHPQINVWPKPAKIWWPTPATTLLSGSFRIRSPYTNKYLCSAVQRYNRIVQTERHEFVRAIHSEVVFAPYPPLESLRVYVHDPEAPLQHGVDETYSMKIALGDDTANLTAQTVWGAMHGLETFSQLVWVWRGLNVVPANLYIEDGPLFAHRGVMIDTGRNYIPPKDLMRNIRAMGANKINVFHWHITDSQSFPVVLPSEPDLAKKGSYGTKMQYSASDVRDIVEYAMAHGVRVVPEIDTPAHSGSWAGAHPDIITCANMFWMPAGAAWPDRLATEPGTGQLNPLNPKTYDVVTNVIRDITTLFPDHFYHGGADEVLANCWKTDPKIQHFLANNGTLDEVLEIFINNTYPFIRSLDRTVVYWEDVLLDHSIHVDASALPKETTILQSWNGGPNNTKLIASNGYRMIVSSSDFYYLDCGRGSFLGNDARYDKQAGDDPGVPFNFEGGSGGSWCGPYKTWQRVYDYDITHGLTEEEARLVIGGEVALWTEQVDAVNLDVMIWPRASAMAEALWSGNRDETGKKRYADATDRLNEWRYRMVERGIGAEPIQPLWCLHNSQMCNLVQ